jgi:hypothetical protein
VFFDVSPPDSAGVRHFSVAKTGVITPDEPRTLTRHAPGRPLRVGVMMATLGPHKLPVVVTKSGKVYEIAPTKRSATGRPVLTDGSGKPMEVLRVGIGPDNKPIFYGLNGKPIGNPKSAFDAGTLPRAKGKQAADSDNFVQKFTVGKNSYFVGRRGMVIDTEVNQAGNGVLMSQNGSLVYYASMVNDVYAYFLTGAKNGGIPPNPNNSVVVGGVTHFRFPHDLPTITEVTNFATANGFTIVDPKALAVELKTSWVDAATVPNPAQYVIVKGISQPTIRLIRITGS